MNEFEKFVKLFRFKEVERAGIVKTKTKLKKLGKKTVRKESSAEHSLMCLILADYFLQDYLDIDRVKVKELLTYHDLIELENGDVFSLKDNTQEKDEKKSFEKLIKKIPKKLKPKYKELFEEFQKQETKESRFAKAIDKLEPIIHFIDYKKIWKENGFTSEKILRKYKEKHFKEFKTIHDFFNQIIEYLNKNKYFIE